MFFIDWIDFFRDNKHCHGNVKNLLKGKRKSSIWFVTQPAVYIVKEMIFSLYKLCLCQNMSFNYVTFCIRRRKKTTLLTGFYEFFVALLNILELLRKERKKMNFLVVHKKRKSNSVHALSIYVVGFHEKGKTNTLHINMKFKNWLRYMCVGT